MRDVNLYNARLRRRVEKTMLPQTCEIVIKDVEVNDYGMRTKTPGYRVIYKGSSLVPSRLDRSKHYRQADIQMQEVNVSEFNINLPRSVVPGLDNAVVCESSVYEIRKVLEDQAWDVTTQALLVRVNDAEPELPDDRLTDGDTGYLLTDAGERILI